MSAAFLFRSVTNCVGPAVTSKICGDACRSQFCAPATECQACELPLVDRTACDVLQRYQIASASLVLQRRAQVLIKATLPQPILRQEQPGWSVWAELAAIVAPLVSNLRQWGNVARERVTVLSRAEE